jgi:membrane protease YdiL (CAAX protease family)
MAQPRVPCRPLPPTQNATSFPALLTRPLPPGIQVVALVEETVFRGVLIPYFAGAGASLGLEASSAIVFGAAMSSLAFGKRAASCSLLPSVLAAPLSPHLSTMPHPHHRCILRHHVWGRHVVARIR